MKNIHTRLALMNEIYHTNMSVEMSESHAGEEFPGLTVRISIPQHKISEPKKG
jgi:hypothetical protein